MKAVNVLLALGVTLVVASPVLLSSPSQASGQYDPSVQTGEKALEILGQGDYFYYFKNSIDKLQSLPNLTEDQNTPRCTEFYSQFEQKGKLKIHVSFGYLDDSMGQSYSVEGYDLGMNAALDGGFYAAFVEGITARCRGSAGACGFEQTEPGKFTKTIQAPDGRAIEVELLAQSGSLTPYQELNTGAMKDEQQEHSQMVRQSFLDALQTDDIVFYLGHSRNGGGMDFFPPHLLSNQRPNYRGYYESKRPGYHDVISALKSRGSAIPLLGVFSCVSEGWFGASFHHASPDSGFIFTPSDMFVGMDEVFRAAIASLDSVLRFQCYDGLSDELQAVRTINTYNVHARNVLSSDHPVDVNAVITAVSPD